MDIFKSAEYHLHEWLINVLKATRYFYMHLSHSTVSWSLRLRQSASMCQLIRLATQTFEPKHGGTYLQSQHWEAKAGGLQVGNKSWATEWDLVSNKWIKWSHFIITFRVHFFIHKTEKVCTWNNWNMVLRTNKKNLHEITWHKDSIHQTLILPLSFPLHHKFGD